MQEEVQLSCLTSLGLYDHFLFLKFFYFLPDSINTVLFSAYFLPSSVLGILGDKKRSLHDAVLKFLPNGEITVERELSWKQSLELRIGEKQKA